MKNYLHLSEVNVQDTSLTSPQQNTTVTMVIGCAQTKQFAREHSKMGGGGVGVDNEINYTTLNPQKKFR